MKARDQFHAGGQVARVTFACPECGGPINVVWRKGLYKRPRPTMEHYQACESYRQRSPDLARSLAELLHAEEQHNGVRATLPRREPVRAPKEPAE